MGSAAETFDDLIPLVDLCKAGKPFEVRAWIDAGNPVNPPDGHFRGMHVIALQVYVVKKSPEKAHQVLFRSIHIRKLGSVFTV